MKKNKQHQLEVVIQELHEQELLNPYQFLTYEELEKKELLQDDDESWWQELLEG